MNARNDDVCSLAPSKCRSLLALRVGLDVVYLLLAPLIILVWLVISRGFTRAKLRRGLLRKFGAVPLRGGDAPCLWIHAVSVGEVLTALPLIAELRANFRDWTLRLSVTTPTGYDVACKHVPAAELVFAPVDLGCIVARFLGRLRPTAIVLVELELWPGFLLAARSRGVPVFVVNGRITERSARRYARSGGAGRWLFSLVRGYGVQTPAYAERFARLGVESSRIAVLGNLKHDRAPSADATDGEALRNALQWPRDGTLVVVAGSTHPGEEAMLVRGLAVWLAQDARVRLVLVPRHTERVDSAALASWGTGVDFVRWSELRARSSLALGGEVLVVDTLGELEKFYVLADVCFVGGTLIEHGGHNLFEVARLERPLVFGPHYGNFAEEAERLIDAEACQRVDSEAQLISAVATLLADGERRRELARRARAVTDSFAGSAARHRQWLEVQLRLFFDRAP